jgi:hypothetical protein
MEKREGNNIIVEFLARKGHAWKEEENKTLVGYLLKYSYNTVQNEQEYLLEFIRVLSEMCSNIMLYIRW